jgi:hypothetical protein
VPLCSGGTGTPRLIRHTRSHKGLEIDGAIVVISIVISVIAIILPVLRLALLLVFVVLGTEASVVIAESRLLLRCKPLLLVALLLGFIVSIVGASNVARKGRPCTATPTPTPTTAPPQQCHIARRNGALVRLGLSGVSLHVELRGQGGLARVKGGFVLRELVDDDASNLCSKFGCAKAFACSAALLEVLDEALHGMHRRGAECVC